MNPTAKAIITEKITELRSNMYRVDNNLDLSARALANDLERIQAFKAERDSIEDKIAALQALINQTSDNTKPMSTADQLRKLVEEFHAITASEESK